MKLDIKYRSTVPSQADLCEHAIVLLNGRHVLHCLSADEEAGLIVRHGGKDRSAGEWPEVTDRGKVEIRFRATCPDWIKETYPERVLSA